MSIDFSSLPVVDLTALRGNSAPDRSASVAKALDKAFSTTGFAYLINSPLSFSHEEIFGMASSFFGISDEEKMRVAKKTFRPENPNTYRGYFPPQPGQQDNLKEGFEIGPASTTVDENSQRSPRDEKVNLGEPNVWPSAEACPPELKSKLERLHSELQDLSVHLLKLLGQAMSNADLTTTWPDNSISTLRFLHYPPQPCTTSNAKDRGNNVPRLCCTPHTDSGILTLLHQDSKGGLEVRSASGKWVPAPYLTDSMVVNVGDLLARASGGRYVATLHRVRVSDAVGGCERSSAGLGRLSVPFFFEPGEDCVVRSVDGGDEGVRYGDHVREKMSSWVEFQEVGGGAK